MKRHILIDKEKVIKNMKIKTLVVGMVSTNCYIVTNDDNNESLIIDPGDAAETIIGYITQNNLIVKAILLTHAHFDHIGAVDELVNKYSIPVYMSRAEEEVALNPSINLSGMVGSGYGIKATNLLDDNDEIELAGMKIKAILTPGHTKGGMCFYFAEHKVLFSGDTLFYESVGRSDLPGGHMGELVRSIREKLFVLPDDVKVYPGHDMSTDIEHEKRYNMFVN